MRETELQEIAKGVKILVLDVDGVLTDGRIILDNEGNEFKSFHVRDGHGIKMLLKAGIHVAIVTGRYSKVVERRAQELGIAEVFQRCREKAAVLDLLMRKYGLREKEVAYMGDDVVDIPVFKRVGISVAVNDATDAAKDYAEVITKNRGGGGAVREVCEFLLKAKGLWESATREYFES